MPVPITVRSASKPVIALFIVAALAGCSRKGEIDPTGGIVTVRSSCPTAAIPVYTGDITLFTAPGRTDAGAIDVVADMTKLRSTCTETGTQYYTEATFEVQARRTDATAARQVTLPYFSTVVRAGNNVVSKRVGQVVLNFAPGALRASATAKAASYVDRDVATIPPEILARVNRKRKAGDEDAAIDPFSTPDVKAALLRTSFELLVGFNLTQDQLKYNATR